MLAPLLHESCDSIDLRHAIYSTFHGTYTCFHGK
ncbi:hypothetical protein HDC95_002021 [Microbacterium sp. AK031]|nr:hypothetical protein [Microbacterium sp. AK031]